MLERKINLWIALSVVVMFACPVSDFAAGQEKEGGFSTAEFRALKTRLDVMNQPWATIPWQVSLTEARELAAKTQKPIFMMAGTGSCLGAG